MERYPANEKETIILYQALEGWLGWRIVHLRTAFPDAVIENRRGRQLRAEFEFAARHFLEHGHNPTGCDLIICWWNNWPGAPLPVWALAELPASLLEMGLRYLWLWNELKEAKREIAVLKEQVAALNARAQFWQSQARRYVADFWIQGIGEFYTDHPSHADRLERFLTEILCLPEVEEIRHRIATATLWKL